MKQFLLVILVILCFQGLHAQIKIGGETAPTFEYATVELLVRYQGNDIFYIDTKRTKSPLIQLPNGESFILMNDSNPKEIQYFNSVNEIHNYMAKKGWRFVSSTALPFIKNDPDIDLTNIEPEINGYIQIVTYEKITH